MKDDPPKPARKPYGDPPLSGSWGGRGKPGRLARARKRKKLQRLQDELARKK